MARHDLPGSTPVLAPLRLHLGPPAPPPPPLKRRVFSLSDFKSLLGKLDGDFFHYFVYLNFGERAVERLKHYTICERYFFPFFKSIKQRDFNSQRTGLLPNYFFSISIPYRPNGNIAHDVRIF